MITTTTSSISYSGNASTSTAYSIPFPFYESNDIVVTETASDGTVTTLTNGVDFTVTTVEDSNGRITSGSLTTATAYASTSTISIKRVTDKNQLLDLVSAGTINAETLETALDRLVMIAQEISRDSSIDVTTDLTTGGTGLVAQTATTTLAARTIAAAADSGLSVTNGDGVSGNPTIDYDASALSTVTTVADGDLVRVADSVITVANFLGRSWPFYRYVDVPTMQFRITSPGSNLTASDEKLIWDSSSDQNDIARVSFVLPEDYASGDISFKLHSYLASGTGGEQYRLVLKLYDDTGDDTIGSQSGTDVEITLTHSDSDCRSEDIIIGSSLSAGNHYRLDIYRDAAHADDTTAKDVELTSVRFQYSADRVTSSWS